MTSSGGVHCLNDGFIHPEKLATALATAAQRAGARVLKADALAIDVNGGRCHGVRRPKARSPPT